MPTVPSPSKNPAAHATSVGPPVVCGVLTSGSSKFACFEILLAFLGRNLRPEELHDLVDNELPRSLPVVEIAAVAARDIPVASDDIPETEEDRRGRSRVAALTHGHLSSIGLPELREVRRTGTFAVIETGSPGDQGRVALTIGHS